MKTRRRSTKRCTSRGELRRDISFLLTIVCRLERIASRQAVVVGQGEAALRARQENPLHTEAFHQVAVRVNHMLLWADQGVQLKQEERLFKQALKEEDAARWELHKILFLSSSSFTQIVGNREKV